MALLDNFPTPRIKPHHVAVTLTKQKKPAAVIVVGANKRPLVSALRKQFGSALAIFHGESLEGFEQLQTVLAAGIPIVGTQMPDVNGFTSNGRTGESVKSLAEHNVESLDTRPEDLEHPPAPILVPQYVVADGNANGETNGNQPPAANVVNNVSDEIAMYDTVEEFVGDALEHFHVSYRSNGKVVVGTLAGLMKQAGLESQDLIATQRSGFMSVAPCQHDHDPAKGPCPICQVYNDRYVDSFAPQMDAEGTITEDDPSKPVLLPNEHPSIAPPDEANDSSFFDNEGSQIIVVPADILVDDDNVDDLEEKA